MGRDVLGKRSKEKYKQRKVAKVKEWEVEDKRRNIRSA
jgi:hypothetical protein